MSATPFDEAYLRSVAGLAHLEIPEDRIAALVEVGVPIHGMFRGMIDVDFGETPPETAYSAGWE